MGSGRRFLTIVIAAAVALAPAGAAMAARAPAQHTQAMHQDHGATQVAVPANQKGAVHCKGASTRSCCCDDKSTCAQTCLQKCFGQTAVMPPERTVRFAFALRLAPPSAARPPGWAASPQLPPPRG